MTKGETTALIRATRLPGRGRAAVVSGLVLAAALVSLAGPASASALDAHATAACSTDAGVTVVVDFGPYGNVASACGADAATGLDTLESAGFSWVGTAQFFDFVCRINGLPTAADDPCVRTPPAGAYWSYWHAERGGAWAYGSQSAATYDPTAGMVEGWSFGAGDPPGVAPPPAIPPTSEPPPPPTSTTPPDSEPTDPGPGDHEETTPAPSTAPVTTTATSAPSLTPGSSPSDTAQPSRSRSASPSSAATAGEAVPVSNGSPLGTLIGLVAAAAIAAAGGVVVLRRRQ